MHKDLVGISRTVPLKIIVLLHSCTQDFIIFSNKLVACSKLEICQKYELICIHSTFTATTIYNLSVSITCSGSRVSFGCSESQNDQTCILCLIYTFFLKKRVLNPSHIRWLKSVHMGIRTPVASSTLQVYNELANQARVRLLIFPP